MMDLLTGNQGYITFIHAKLLLGYKDNFYKYLASHICDSSGLVLYEHQFVCTIREALNILDMRILFVEYNLRDIRISHPYRLSNNIKGNQRYITFIHASLPLGYKYEFYVYLTSLI